MKTNSEKPGFENMVKEAEKEAKRKMKVIRTGRNSCQLVWADDNSSFLESTLKTD